MSFHFEIMTAKTLIALAIICRAHLASAHSHRIPKVEVIYADKLSLGEGPHWDHEANALYWVDIFESTVLKYDRRTEIVTHVIVDKVNKTTVSWVVPVAGCRDKFAISFGHKFALLTWDGVSTEPIDLEILVDVDARSELMFDDGKADPRGRLWSGTMAPYSPAGPREFKGTLYSLNDDAKSATPHLHHIGISNGLAWSSDTKTMYYIDSFNESVSVFDYDIATAEISNRRVIFNLTSYGIAGLPDGMTIDKDDNLWATVAGGSGVYQVDPKTGSILRFVNISMPMTTSCTWGGENLDELYITSSSYYDTNNTYANSGYTFRVTGLGTYGRPGAAVRL